MQYADKNSSEIVLTEKQKQSVYKLYIYCSNLWLDIQQKNIEGLDSIDLNLKVDIPVTEFKFPTDFHTQLFKAHEFFKFCSSSTPFDSISKWMICEKGKNNFSEYLIDVFELFRHTINNHILKKSSLPQSTHGMFDMFLYDVNSTEDICGNLNEGIKYLRNHFFVKIDENSYYLLSPSFLIDKFYEGLVFDAWNAVVVRKGKDSIADSIKDFSELKSKLGRPFAEEYLFYTLIDKCFTSSSFIKIKGSQLADVEAPPDYYMREENNIYFFECKDALFNNNIRYSTNLDEIKKELLNKTCKDGTGGKRKGGAQLLYSIDKFVSENSLSKYDRIYSSDDKIYPIIVTTNSAFDAYGVNLFILIRFTELAKEKYPSLQGKIKLPIIINMDCFIKLMNDLHNGTIKFNELLDEYQMRFLENYSIRLMPSFYHFIRMMYHGKEMTQAELNYMFGDMMETFKQTFR